MFFFFSTSQIQVRLLYTFYAIAIITFYYLLKGQFSVVNNMGERPKIISFWCLIKLAQQQVLFQFLGPVRANSRQLKAVIIQVSAIRRSLITPIPKLEQGHRLCHIHFVLALYGCRYNLYLQIIIPFASDWLTFTVPIPVSMRLFMNFYIGGVIAGNNVPNIACFCQPDTSEI